MTSTKFSRFKIDSKLIFFFNFILFLLLKYFHGFRIHVNKIFILLNVIKKKRLIFGISFKILIKNIRQPHSRYFMLSFSSWATNYIIFYILFFFKSTAWKILFIEIYDLRNAFAFVITSVAMCGVDKQENEP